MICKNPNTIRTLEDAYKHDKVRHMSQMKVSTTNLQVTNMHQACNKGGGSKGTFIKHLVCTLCTRTPRLKPSGSNGKGEDGSAANRPHGRPRGADPTHPRPDLTNC